jgi:c(7)-type cytochrome triheme protein
MRFLPIAVLAVCLAGCQANQTSETKTEPQAAEPQATQPAAPSDGTPPETILIASPYGNVTFTHQKHFERVKNDCSVCHTKVFPQSRAPLNYKKALHRAAEASMTSCAYCHSIGNSAFAADSNCTKCHAVKDYSKR